MKSGSLVKAYWQVCWRPSCALHCAADNDDVTPLSAATQPPGTLPADGSARGPTPKLISCCAVFNLLSIWWIMTGWMVWCRVCPPWAGLHHPARCSSLQSNIHFIQFPMLSPAQVCIFYSLARARARAGVWTWPCPVLRRCHHTIISPGFRHTPHREDGTMEMFNVLSFRWSEPI